MDMKHCLLNLLKLPERTINFWQWLRWNCSLRLSFYRFYQFPFGIQELQATEIVGELKSKNIKMEEII
jgi:hypothetical protein